MSGSAYMEVHRSADTYGMDGRTRINYNTRNPNLNLLFASEKKKDKITESNSIGKTLGEKD